MKTLLMIAGILALIAGCFALSAFIFELLWNYVMPAIFKLPTLTFWQSFAFVMLLGFVGKAIQVTVKSK